MPGKKYLPCISSAFLFINKLIAMNVIIASILCFIVGGSLSYVLFRYVLKTKYESTIREAHVEAEVIKKNKLLEVKEKFLNKKAGLHYRPALYINY